MISTFFLYPAQLASSGDNNNDNYTNTNDHNINTSCNDINNNTNNMINIKMQICGGNYSTLI